MLKEIKKVSQKEKGIHRRWFSDNYFDLIIWYNDNNEIIGFQLCYDINGIEKAITLKGNYYSHNKVDQGQDRSGMHRTPVLIQDGVFNKNDVLEKFKLESIEIEDEARDFVIK